MGENKQKLLTSLGSGVFLWRLEEDCPLVAGWQKYSQTQTTTTGDYDVSFSRCVCNKEYQQDWKEAWSKWVGQGRGLWGWWVDSFLWEEREKTYKRRGESEKRPRFAEAIRDILELMTLYCVTVVVYFRENNGWLYTGGQQVPEFFNS